MNSPWLEGHVEEELWDWKFLSWQPTSQGHLLQGWMDPVGVSPAALSWIYLSRDSKLWNIFALHLESSDPETMLQGVTWSMVASTNQT